MPEQVEKKRKKRVVFVVCQKGGVGKTTFARAYLDYMRSVGYRVAALDADGQVGQLLQYYGTRNSEDKKLSIEQNPLVGVGYFDVRDDKQRDMLINAAGIDADLIIVDMPGGSVQELGKVSGTSKSLLTTYADYGWEVVVVIVISHMIASIRTIGESVRSFEDATKYVAVVNLAWGDRSDFVVFDGFNDINGKARHGNGIKALKNVGGEIIELKKLMPSTYALLDVDSIKFCDAPTNQDLTIAHRQRVKDWMNAFGESLKGTVLSP